MLKQKRFSTLFFISLCALALPLFSSSDKNGVDNDKEINIASLTNKDPYPHQSEAFDPDNTYSLLSKDAINGQIGVSQTGECHKSALASKETKKPWTFIVYMAADNDLYPFADRNLEQMASIGSNQNMNILVHLDIKRRDYSPDKIHKKVTKHLFIKKNKIEQIGPDMCMDSGLAETLIGAVTWAVTDYPSEHLGIIFWNHGMGDLNLEGRIINPAELFFYNPNTNMIELDRSIGFIDYVMQDQSQRLMSNVCVRGVCFDETTGNSLDDQKLCRALDAIVALRGNKKIDIIIFDACFMMGIGTGYICSKRADFMTGSEEVELGTGYDYNKVLSLPAAGDVSPRNLARHIVSVYEQVYNPITRDYTHSAFDLALYEPLNRKVNDLAAALANALKSPGLTNQIYEIIRKSKSKAHCTHFDEPSYIDLRHFCINVLKNIEDEKTKFKGKLETYPLVKAIKYAARDCCDAIKDLVIGNVAGVNLAKAGGISVYFPEKRIHSSYPQTEFAKQNYWLEFIHMYTNKHMIG
ncbi:MAG: Peptidase C11 clostripain [candidate division TM6 bacterium GW2011_GWE2_41_16]|nr:MAG: Peptidase C11 clostripain [candidate division TM6 bacterium GW2011_GWE2_41_16]